MRNRVARVAVGTLIALTSAVSLPSEGVGLSCVQHPDVERAAREALAGDHPLWADGYLVGRVDRIEHPLHQPIRLTVTPTHVFDGEVADRARLAARSDGPPDPVSWHVGGHYFLALDDAPELEGVSALVAPCAPNFRITETDQLDRLLGAARAVEVREGVVRLSAASDSPLGAAVVLAAAASVIGLGSWLAFRRRVGRDRRA